MRHFLLGICLIMSTSAVFPQTSVSFENPENLEPLIQYRLPEWGYDNLWVDFYLNSHGEKNPNGTTVNSRLQPRYIRYWESEEKIAELDIMLGLESGYVNQADGPSGPDARPFRGEYDFSGYVYEYFSGDYFALLEGDFWGSSFKDFEREQERDWVVHSKPVIGIGWGRIRNVTPLLRALRFEERYRSLGREGAFSMDTRHTMAQLMAQERGFNVVHDRHHKYFWDAFHGQLPDLQSGLGPFDYFYLDDVLRENLGNRYEGCDVMLTLDYLVHNTEDDNWDPTGGVSLRGRLFKNLTLEHQLGIRGRLHSSFALVDDDRDVSTHNMKLNMVLQHLWVLSDRLNLANTMSGGVPLVEGDVSYQYSEPYIHLGPSDSWVPTEGYIIESSLSYYVEDQVMISARANLRSEVVASSRKTSWGFNITGSYSFLSTVY
ncbi:MAG: hypothetical protein K9N46_13295 [Candidatus Marinimicrobia bacterium]|nr:hypothetical protein [Candidatus Neomarinimicrobiota bacterium]MCF7829758.1 hypothetical protein [Candidatus Neomarinimicrobiota bacterium]MCF7881708.1 hypothetical protein [Candidatus Neomarinimicrobiota bacterium]